MSWTYGTDMEMAGNDQSCEVCAKVQPLVSIEINITTYFPQARTVLEFRELPEIRDRPRQGESVHSKRKRFRLRCRIRPSQAGAILSILTASTVAASAPHHSKAPQIIYGMVS